MSTHEYVPNELLSRLVGRELFSVEFVFNDRVVLGFQPDDGDGVVRLQCFAWPVVRVDGRDWRESDLGYADVLRRMTPGEVIGTDETSGRGLRIDLATGSIVLNPAREDVDVEIAMLAGFEDEAWMVWRPGEVAFEHLAWPLLTD